MSRVTDTILVTKEFDMFAEKLKEINRFFFFSDHSAALTDSEPTGPIGLVSIKDIKLPKGWYGGTKYLQSDIAIGAINYLDIDGFVQYLKTIEWKYPESVQLIVKEEESDRFRIINLMEVPKQNSGYFGYKNVPEGHVPLPKSCEGKHTIHKSNFPME